MRRAALVVAGVLAVVTACSGGGGKATVARKATTSTSSPQVLGEQIGAAPAPAAGGDASRFTLTDGTTVLVPAGALIKGAEVRVRRNDSGVTAGDGAIEGGPATYEVSVSAGTMLKPIAMQLAVVDAEGRTGPVAVRYDDATKSWTPANSDASAGTLTIYAAQPGTYGWVRWSWQAAAGVAAQTARSVVGQAEESDPTLSCGSASALAPRFAARGTSGTALRWCAGSDGGNDGVQLANRGVAPVGLVVTGMVDGVTTRRSALTDPVLDILRRHAALAGGENVLAPGDRAALGLTATVAAKATAAQNGLSQFYVDVAGAAAFAVGLYAGSAAVATTVLNQDDVRSALLQDLDAAGCADAVGAASADLRPADQVAASLQALVTRCVTPSTVAAIVTAAGKRSELRTAFARTAATLPDSAVPYLAPAVAAAVEPLVAEIAGGEVTLTPVEPPPTTTTTAPGATTTAAPGATTTTIAPPFATTTLVTVPGTTTVPGATTTTRPAATTTTVAGPPPALTLAVRTCLAIGTFIPVSGAGLTASGKWTMTYQAPPKAANGTSNGTATATGTMTDTFSCAGKARGTWTAVLTDVTTGRNSVGVTFTVA